MNKNSPFPFELDYRMPAEWEPHEATWLTWPFNMETWPGQQLSDIESVYLQIIKALQGGEKINLLVRDDVLNSRITSLFTKHGIVDSQVVRFFIPTDDVWMRDYGPNFVVSSELAFNNWEFNAWGGKYEWENDNAVGPKLEKQLNLTVFHPGIYLEGGAIDVNGKGMCLTTRECLLNPNRNPELGQSEMESFLKNYLGVQKVIWCRGELMGDDTDGHIDNLVRFVGENRVICAVEEDSEDPNYASLQENLKTLQDVRDDKGKSLDIVTIPMPGWVGPKEDRLPASYANFYIGNETVLLPVYNHANDSKTISILQEVFPDKTITPILSNEFIWGLGGIHCITQQQPQAPQSTPTP